MILRLMGEEENVSEYINEFLKPYQKFISSYYPFDYMMLQIVEKLIGYDKETESTQFFISIAIVIGPTPPGTGVMALQ